MNEILPDGNKPIQIGDPSFVYKNVYHPIVWLGADPYRPRVEMLTIKDRRYVFIRRYETNDSDENMDYNYRIPGGSIDADSDKLQQAIAETNEEGLLAVKNAKYSGVSYYEQYHPGFLLKGGDMPIEYKGSMNDVFVAEYDGVYDKSKVEEKDLDDDMAKNGKFYSIVAVAKDLKPEHLRALVYSNMVDSSIVNFMRRVADSKGSPIGPQSDPVQTPLSGVESHVVAMEAQLTAKERKEIPDREYGLPKKRKYPMPDKKHVRAAIRFFNYVDKEDEAELARNINKMAKKYDMVDEIKVGSDNRFSKYWKGEVTEASSMRSSGAGAVPFDVAKTIEDIISNDRMFISQSIWDNLDNIVYYDTEEVGNSTVGSVVVFKDCGSNIGHLMLSVDTSATGFGVANDLMDDLLRNWANLGVDSIQVSVNDDYDEAIKLFLSYGFKEVEAESDDTRCFMLSGNSSAGDGERVEEQLMRCARDTMFQKYHVSPFPTIYSEMSTTFYNSLDDAIQALNVYYPCDNGLYYVFTKLDNQKVIPVGRIILRANDWKFNGWYDCFKFDKETTNQYISQIDVNEVSGMRDEAIHLAQKVLRGEHDYGLLTESESGEIWANISTPDKFVTEAIDSDIQNRIYRLNAKMNRFKYGFLYKGKILTDDYSKYRTMTVAEIDRYQCGVCWDFVNYEANWFRKNQIPFKTFFIEWNDPMTSTHTFLVYKLPDDPNYYYFESSFEKYQGVHEVISYSDAIDLVVKEMKEFGSLDKYDYEVWEYTASDALSHMTALQYMKTITKVDPIKKTNYGFDILESVIMEAPGDPDDPGTATDYTGGGTEPPAGNTMTDDQPTDYTQGGAGEEPAGGDEGEDAGNPLGADTGDDAGGDTGTDDPGAGDDAPTDYTDAGDDMGGDPGADPGEDTGTADDTSSDMSDSSTSDSSNNNIVVKNYSLIKDFEKAYTLIDDINKTIDSTLRASSVENQVLAQVSRNLTSVKEFIKSFVQFHFKDNDYAYNLYYYTLAIQFLKINLAMVEKITIIGD